MFKTKCFYVYILINQLRTVLYTGVTNNLKQRIQEHYFQRGQKLPLQENITHIIYCISNHNNASTMLLQEKKELKVGQEKRKMKLINEMNPSLKFLNEELFGV